MTALLRALGLRLLAWLMRRVAPRYDIDGIEFVDLRRSGDSDRAEVLRALHDAMYEIEWAGFRDQVVGKLELVVGNDKGERGVPEIHGYMCSFTPELRDPHALACRLIWIATYFKETESGANPEGAYQKCLEAELRFVTKFPHSEDWVRFLMERHHPMVIGW